jgi:hypothetical protein
MEPTNQLRWLHVRGPWDWKRLQQRWCEFSRWRDDAGFDHVDAIKEEWRDVPTVTTPEGGG